MRVFRTLALGSIAYGAYKALKAYRGRERKALPPGGVS